jgi:SAM-dependent methyltransferase
MKQLDAFLGGEANHYYARNRDKSAQDHPVVVAIISANLKPKSILEIGCCDGRVLEILRTKLDCLVTGVEPSAEAVNVGRSRGLNLFLGSATELPLGTYDLIIFGFCLYLVDRTDLFKAIYLADDRLIDGGHIAIHDFHDGPYARTYSHAPALQCYHMDNSALFTAHPGYTIIQRSMQDEQIGVTILRKNFANAFPLR